MGNAGFLLREAQGPRHVLPLTRNIMADMLARIHGQGHDSSYEGGTHLPNSSGVAVAVERSLPSSRGQAACPAPLASCFEKLKALDMYSPSPITRNTTGAPRP